MNAKAILTKFNEAHEFFWILSRLLASTFFLSAGIVLAADLTEQVTVTGTISVGTLDSAIVPASGNGLSFVTNSDVARKIFDICHVNDICRVTGIVKPGEYGWLESVVQVELVERR